MLTLSWPPTSHTVKEMFLNSTVSTLKPVAHEKLAFNRLHKDLSQLLCLTLPCLTDGGNGGDNLAQLQLVCTASKRQLGLKGLVTTA